MALKIYKRGQGYYTRLYSALTAAAMVVIGCVVLWQKLQAQDNVYVEFFVPTGVAAVFGALIFWIINKPSIADFMIAAEGEIKKVSWSSRQDIMSSTMVVIGVVIFMSLLLLVADVACKYVLMEVIKAY
jgi:preprotein translocase subunit SecE